MIERNIENLYLLTYANLLYYYSYYYYYSTADVYANSY